MKRYGWAPETYAVPNEPRFDWVRQYAAGRSITELEMHFAALHDPHGEGNAVFAFRDAAFTDQVPKPFLEDFSAEDAESARKMHDLKRRIRGSGYAVLDGYPASWAGMVGDKPVAGNLERFGTFVLDQLWARISSCLIDTATPKDHEGSAHHEFLRHRSNSFIGRPALLKEIHRFVEHVPSGILCLNGKPGIGKSSIVAAFLDAHIHNTSARGVVAHFVGITPESTDIRFTLHRICHELVRRFSLEADVPMDMQGLTNLFSGLLRDCVKLASGKLIVAFDALDHLEDKHQARSLSWLPETLPHGVIVLVSSGESDVLQAVRARAGFHEIVVSPLSLHDRGHVARSMLARYRKKLDESPFNNQLKELLQKRDSGIPLFLQVACEELRVGVVFEGLMAKLRSMASNIPGLMLNVLERLEGDHHHLLVCVVLQLFSLARHGLRVSDVSQLLRQAHTMKHMDLPLPSPIAVSSFLLALEPFLVTLNDGYQSKVLFHGEFRACIFKRYLSAANAKLIPAVHRILAQHYLMLVDPQGDRSFVGRDTCAFREVLHHLSRAGDWGTVSSLLTSLNFIQGKCSVGLTYDLVGDYLVEPDQPKLFEKEQRRVLAAAAVMEFDSFVSRNAHVLHSKPALALQQALNEPDDRSITAAARALIKTGVFGLFGVLRFM